ncbi:3'-5' exonuclease, partial [Streptomyces fungicidicus]|uniref:3'-5' exonuclease n=1 Tax=Streptomyces fungicidicus TaxID=68203 RepID=UPI003824A87B
MRAIAALLRERHDRHGTPYAAIAVGVPRDAARQLAFTLAEERYGIRACEIGGNAPAGSDTVRIGPLHGFKGLEFQRVFLAEVSEGLVPHQRLETYRHEQTERYRQEEQRSRSLLFVAAAGPGRTGDHMKRDGQPFSPGPRHEEPGHATEVLADDGPQSGSAAAHSDRTTGSQGPAECSSVAAWLRSEPTAVLSSRQKAPRGAFLTISASRCRRRLKCEPFPAGEKGPPDSVDVGHSPVLAA